MPPVRFSDPVTLVLDVVAWGVIHAGTGWFVHRLPVERLSTDGWLFRARRFERGGRFYARLGIRRWKDALPEAGAVFAGGLSKRRLPSKDTAGLERFAVETRRAELGHWLAAIASPVFAIWNTWPVVLVMVAYGLGVNLPFVAIQRFNRLRIARTLARRSAR